MNQQPQHLSPEASAFLLQQSWLHRRWDKAQNHPHRLLRQESGRIHQAVGNHDPYAPPLQWWLIGEQERLLALLEEALAIYDRVIAIAPLTIPAYLQKGQLLSLFLRREEAHIIYTQALELIGQMSKTDPFSAQAFLYRGDALYLLRREEWRMKFDQQGEAADEDEDEEENGVREILQAYDEAIRLDPALTDAYVNKGWLLFAESLPGALEAYDRALALAPDDAEIYSKKSTVLWERGRFEGAVSVISEAIRLNPTNPTFYRQKLNQLSYTAVTAEREEEMERIWEQIVRLEQQM